MKYFVFDIQILDIQIEFHGKVSILQKMKIGIFFNNSDSDPSFFNSIF